MSFIVFLWKQVRLMLSRNGKDSLNDCFQLAVSSVVQHFLYVIDSTFMNWWHTASHVTH